MPSHIADISVIIPALNERENLSLLLPLLKEVLGDLHLTSEVIVVDGRSDDGTREVAARWGAQVVTQKSRGYGGALISGFEAATAPFMVTMDADLSHPPVFLADFWQHRNEAEIIIGSRYVRGGSADMSKFRLLLSLVLNAVCRRLLAFPIRDLSSGFRMYQCSAVRARTFQARDFDILEEILVKAHVDGCRILEVPFRYGARRSGTSHIRLLRFGWSFIKTLKRMRDLRFREKRIWDKNQRTTFSNE